VNFDVPLLHRLLPFVRMQRQANFGLAKMQRREFLSGVVSTAGIALPPLPEYLNGKSLVSESGRFVWGVSSSAIQIEGALTEDGRGSSIWDGLRAGSPPRGPEPAADSYHRWRDDVDLIRGLGISAYRFSVSWPRICPTAIGPVNWKAFDYYARLVDALLEVEVTPWICIHHWDLPTFLQEDGGWMSRDTVNKFVDYVQIVMGRFGDRVHHWAPLNEPNIVAYAGYATGVFAPGTASEQAFYAATHHQNLAQGLALKLLLAAGHEAGPILSVRPVRPATANAADVNAAGIHDLVLNRAFLDPLLKGIYPGWLAKRMAPLIHSDDLQSIKASPSFLGINYYGPEYRRFEAGAPFGNEGVNPPNLPRTAYNIVIEAQGLEEVLLQIRQAYDDPPLVITENGASFADIVDSSGRVIDRERIDYLRSHIEAAQRAMKSGARLKGYFVWSLLDNWEWTAGYDQRFGLVHVDFESGRRIPKASYEWYSRVVKSGE
jgi:beta-glucosidase